jgi:hypothetical protein
MFLRPDSVPGPEECPADALLVMRLLGLEAGDHAPIELDTNQMGASPLRLYAGPIESYLYEPLGTLDASTRLYGRTWTGGRHPVIRYDKARPPQAEVLPICFEARLEGNRPLTKRPDSPPGIAILEDGEAAVYVVHAFH